MAHSIVLGACLILQDRRGLLCAAPVTFGHLAAVNAIREIGSVTAVLKSAIHPKDPRSEGVVWAEQGSNGVIGDIILTAMTREVSVRPSTARGRLK